MFGTIAKLSTVALLLVLATAGLAVAGVDLPGPADDAFEKLGLTLPAQAGGGGQGGDENAGSSGAVRDVIESTPPRERGCEFGHAVAAAARGEALPEGAQDACDADEESAASQARKHRPAASGDAAGQSNGTAGRGPGDNRSGTADPGAGRAFGQETSDRAKGQRDATPEARREFGQETADRAKQLGATPPSPTHPTPPVGTPQGGPPTGQTHAADPDAASGGRKP